MKRLAILYIILIAVCSQVNAQRSASLTGKWIVDANATFQRVSTLEASAYSKMSDETKSDVKRSFASRTYTFSTDGKVDIAYTLSNGTNRQVSGTSTYQSDVLTITLQQRSKQYTVQWVNKDRICLVDKNPGTSNLIKSIYLNRTN